MDNTLRAYNPMPSAGSMVFLWPLTPGRVGPFSCLGFLLIQAGPRQVRQVVCGTPTAIISGW